MNLLLYGLVALSILSMLGGIAYKIRESGKESVRLEWAEANRLQREKEQRQANKAAEKKEQGDAKAKVVYRTITKQVDKVVDRVEYRNLCLDPDGLRLARDSIRGEIADPAKPDKPVRPSP